MSLEPHIQTLDVRACAEVSQAMAAAASAFLDTLDDRQTSAARMSFDDDRARRTWHYTPVPRAGLALGAMTPSQHKLAHRLAATGLTTHAYAQATTIMGFEDVLDRIEGGGLGRSATNYFVSIFGEPGSGPWGWRFEGHHVSVNYTIDGDVLSCTPLFLGSNPAIVLRDGRPVVRPLLDEEECARELVTSLDADALARAVVSDRAPSDIVTANLPRIDGGAAPGDAAWLDESGLDDAQRRALSYTRVPSGLPATAMDARQRALLTDLVAAYVRRVAVISPAFPSVDELSFVWAGSLHRGEPHYYRVEGPRLLAEYDNTQNDANHIHSVWRDPDDDFGTLLLARHQAQAHRA